MTSGYTNQLVSFTQSATISHSQTLRLASNWANNSDFAAIKIYGCKIWEDGALEYAPEESYFPWGGEEPENGLLPEGCPTVEDISGLWVLAEDGDIQLYIFADATLYGGVFTFVDADGTETAGTIAAYSEENPDGSVEYGYTFTTDGGDLWSTLYVGEEGVGDDLYFGQGGDPHFVRPKD